MSDDGDGVQKYPSVHSGISSRKNFFAIRRLIQKVQLHGTPWIYRTVRGGRVD